MGEQLQNESCHVSSPSCTHGAVQTPALCPATKTQMPYNTVQVCHSGFSPLIRTPGQCLPVFTTVYGTAHSAGDATQDQQPWQRLQSEVVFRDERWHGGGALGTIAPTAGRIPRFSRQCIIPPSLSHPPSRRLSILLILFLICTSAICLQFFLPFIFVIAPYCTWVDQAQIPFKLLVGHMWMIVVGLGGSQLEVACKRAFSLLSRKSKLGES
ncbi:hypothetical protein JOQ06_020647, partial [Pogonophryne albipinna]